MCEETKKSPFPHKSEIGFVRINQQASIAAPYFYSVMGPLYEL